MNQGCPDFRATSRLTRRSLLTAGAAGFAGLNLPNLLRASEGPTKGVRAKAKHVIFLHQFGGPSHIDTFDMKPDAPDGIRGEFKPIQSSQPGLIDQRALAEVLEGHRPVRPDPVGPPRDEEPQLGDLLQPDRPRPAARRHPAPRHPGALPVVRQRRRPVPAGRGPSLAEPRRLSLTSSATAASRPARPPASSARHTTPSSSAATRTSPTSGSPS